MEEEVGKVLDFRKKKARSPVDWKIRYEIRKTPKKPFPKHKIVFWIKFVIYIAMVTYFLRQCGV